MNSTFLSWVDRLRLVQNRKCLGEGWSVAWGSGDENKAWDNCYHGDHRPLQNGWFWGNFFEILQNCSLTFKTCQKYSLKMVDKRHAWRYLGVLLLSSWRLIRWHPQQIAINYSCHGDKTFACVASGARQAIKRNIRLLKVNKTLEFGWTWARFTCWTLFIFFCLFLPNQRFSVFLIYSRKHPLGLEFIENLPVNFQINSVIFVQILFYIIVFFCFLL